MVEFKTVISDPRTGKTHQWDVKGHHANSLIGKRIGDEVDGIFVSLPGYKLVVTGGPDTVQVNMKITVHGSKSIEDLLKEEESK